MHSKKCLPHGSVPSYDLERGDIMIFAMMIGHATSDYGLLRQRNTMVVINKPGPLNLSRHLWMNQLNKNSISESARYC